MEYWKIEPNESVSIKSQSEKEAVIFFDENTETINKKYTITYTDENGTTTTYDYAIPSGQTCHCKCSGITITDTTITLDGNKNSTASTQYSVTEGCEIFFMNIPKWLKITNNNTTITFEAESDAGNERNATIGIKLTDENNVQACKEIIVTQKPNKIKLNPRLAITGTLLNNGSLQLINTFQISYQIKNSNDKVVDSYEANYVNNKTCADGITGFTECPHNVPDEITLDGNIDYYYVEIYVKNCHGWITDSQGNCICNTSDQIFEYMWSGNNLGTRYGQRVTFGVNELEKSRDENGNWHIVCLATSKKTKC